MIHIMVQLFKASVVVFVILLAGQIPIRGKRICDYVQDLTQHGSVQNTMKWVSHHFDFVEGHIGAEATKKLHAAEHDDWTKPTSHKEPMPAKAEKSRLSGLFKN